MVLFLFTSDSSWVRPAAGSICCYSWRQWRSNRLCLWPVLIEFPAALTSGSHLPPQSPLTIPCLYWVTLKTWAGPGWFLYILRSAWSNKACPGWLLTWDFWVILKTNMFLKDVIALDFVKLCMSVCILLPNTEGGGWRTFSSFYFQFAKLPSWFKACALLWKEIKTTKNVLPKQLTNIPSLFIHRPKNIGGLKCWWISFVLFLAFQNSLAQVHVIEKASLV